MVNVLITIGIFLIIQTLAAVWWAATISTKMDFVIETSKGTKKELEDHAAFDLATFATKIEISQSLMAHQREDTVSHAMIEREMVAIWKKIDSLTVNGG